MKNAQASPVAALRMSAQIHSSRSRKAHPPLQSHNQICVGISCVLGCAWHGFETKI
jgi:hypothetical protein